VHISILYYTFLTIGANNVQVNPTTRSAYTLGPGQQELEPFTYWQRARWAWTDRPFRPGPARSAR